MERTDIHSRLKRTNKFLAEYAATLMAVGVQSARVLINTERMARSFGFNTDVVLLPKTLSITLRDPDSDHTYTYVKRISEKAANFRTNMELSKLSWDALDYRLSLDEVERRYKLIVGEKRESDMTVLLFVAMANACFCRLFDGNMVSMMVVFIATLAGFYAKQRLVARGVSSMAVFVACSFLSTMIGASDYLLIHGGTEDMSLATSMLYLVPGVPLINGVMDIIAHHVLNGLVRIANACMLIASMTVGLMLTLLLTGIDFETVTATVRPNIVQAAILDGLFAAVAGAGFAIISNPPRRALAISAFLACVGHGVRYFLMHHGALMMNQAAASTIAAFAIGMLAIVFARRIHCPAECFAFPSLLPMVPGMFAYKAVIALINVVSGAETDTMLNVSTFFHYGMLTMLTMVGMVVGCVVPMFIFHRESFSVTRTAPKLHGIENISLPLHWQSVAFFLQHNHKVSRKFAFSDKKG